MQVKKESEINSEKVELNDKNINKYIKEMLTIYHESKVIVIVNGNTYILPNEEKSNESKLYINGELVYEESLEEIFSNIKKIKK